MPSKTTKTAKTKAAQVPNTATKKAPRGSTTPKGMLPPLPGTSTQARLQRAHDRALDRIARTITAPRRQKLGARMEEAAGAFRASKTKKELTIPFGKVTLSKFPTSDPAPKITSRKEDFSNASVGHKYKELTPTLFPKRKSMASQQESDSLIAEELLSTMQNDARPKKHRIEDGAQLNAAAKMVTIALLSEPERVPGTAKLFRGTLRAIQAKELSAHDAFASDNPTFSMAINPKAQRRLVNRERAKQTKPPTPPKGFASLSAHMSDSSDDEY
jgi:hypothetical protein